MTTIYFADDIFLYPQGGVTPSYVWDIQQAVSLREINEETAAVLFRRETYLPEEDILAHLRDSLGFSPAIVLFSIPNSTQVSVWVNGVSQGKFFLQCPHPYLPAISQLCSRLSGSLKTTF